MARGGATASAGGAQAPVDTRQTGNPAFKASVYTAAPTGQATMTVAGTAIKALYFTVLMVAGAVVGWSLVETDPTGAVVWPWWTWWLSLGAFVVAMVTLRNPGQAAVTGTLYALLQGVVLGSISAIYDVVWNGIVLQATIVTIGIMLSVLVLYLLGVLRATPRFVKMVVIGTVGVALLYLFAWVMALFGIDMVFWAKPTSAGIFWSLVIVGLAALNFVLDFEAIERYSSAGAPKVYEWQAAFGVILTLVWLYLEVLRLIALSRSRE
ncbi:MAG: Bax inhibitor-1/YccA family protein [Acidimicrobiia bacterium]|nr:Bax inhibitor-1/YccA family protein [Acidimicrobiia bacterium]